MNTQLVAPQIVAFRSQRIAVEFDGVTALRSAMTPTEKAGAEKALANLRYSIRNTPQGMAVYVLRPPQPALAAPIRLGKTAKQKNLRKH